MKKVKYKELNWWVLKEDEKGKLLFLEDRLRPEMIEKYFIHDSDYDVKFNYDYTNIWWKDSYVRHVLNSGFLQSQLDINDLNIMETTVEYNGEKSTTKDHVRLLTKEEAEELDADIRKTADHYGYWLMSPLDWNGPFAYEFIVGGSSNTGILDNYNVHGTHGVRPVVYLKSDAPVTELTDNIENTPVREVTLQEISKLSISKFSNKQKKLAVKINKIIDNMNILIRQAQEKESDCENE